jgi:SAM-dependent methyltransferase
MYPMKYARMLLDDPQKLTLEIGCGLGRVLKHYHYSGFRVCGIERSDVAVKQLLAENPALDVRVGDVLDLPYNDQQFDTALAFGVFHNLETGMEQALAETARCLKLGGRFCISMRPDNLEMRLNECYWNWKQRSKRGNKRHFHRWLVGKREFQELLGQHDLKTESVHYARNVSLLWRLPFLRERENGQTEGDRRARGYRLNALGGVVDKLLMAAFPSQVCNVLVFIGHKQGTIDVSNN